MWESDDASIEYQVEIRRQTLLLIPGKTPEFQQKLCPQVRLSRPINGPPKGRDDSHLSPVHSHACTALK